MIPGTSGSDAKFLKPSASQSKRTQTRSSSLGSRKTVEPLDPYCVRFSALVVEKMLRKRSKSSTVVVASSIRSPCRAPRHRGSAPSVRRVSTAGRDRRIGRTPYSVGREGMLEGPDGGGGPAADPGLLVDVLDVMAGGLGGDPEGVADLLVGLARHQRKEHLELTVRQLSGQLARAAMHAMPGGGEHRVDRLGTEPAL